MNDSVFIKAAAYGGYDKAEVDKKLEFLYENIRNLKNNLREYKLLLKNYENGDTEEKAHENVLAAERANITQLQVKNKTLSEKCKVAREEAQKYKEENEKLSEKIALLESELSDAKLKLSDNITDSAEILSMVFREAQKSGATIIESSKAKAEKIETEAKKFADEFINDVNVRAEKIISDAENDAVDIKKDAEKDAENMRVASENLHLLMLKDVEKISEDMNKIKSALILFESSGISQIEKSSQLLSAIREKLSEGGIPVFNKPVEKSTPVKENAEKPEEKKTEDSELDDELARLAAIAKNLDDDDFDFDTSPDGV